MYEKIFKFLARFFNLKTEIKVLTRPDGMEHWGYSDYSDSVYQLYVTNYNKNGDNGLFGFWKHSEELEDVYRQGIIKLCSNLKWAYTIRIKRWLKLK